MSRHISPLSEHDATGAVTNRQTYKYLRASRSGAYEQRVSRGGWQGVCFQSGFGLTICGSTFTRGFMPIDLSLVIQVSHCHRRGDSKLFIRHTIHCTRRGLCMQRETAEVALSSRGSAPSTWAGNLGGRTSSESKSFRQVSESLLSARCQQTLSSPLGSSDRPQGPWQILLQRHPRTFHGVSITAEPFAI
jgi:hypothetical protein